MSFALPIQGEQQFEALTELLMGLDAGRLLQLAPRLSQQIPELAPMIGFDQRSPHHAYDLMTHVAKVVEAVPADPALRWAALLHDTGKIPTFTQDATGRGHFYGHAGQSAAIAERVLSRLQAPDVLRRQVVTLIERHMASLPPEKPLLRTQLDSLGWDTLGKLLCLKRADMSSKGVWADLTVFERIEESLREIRTESTGDTGYCEEERI